MRLSSAAQCGAPPAILAQTLASGGSTSAMEAGAEVSELLAGAGGHAAGAGTIRAALPRTSCLTPGNLPLSLRVPCKTGDMILGFQGWCKAQLTFILLLLQHLVSISCGPRRRSRANSRPGPRGSDGLGRLGARATLDVNRTGKGLASAPPHGAWPLRRAPESPALTYRSPFIPLPSIFLLRHRRTRHPH